MYKSPIEVLTSQMDDVIKQMQKQMQEQQEEQIFQSVLNIGVNVDKDELIKALAYDRQQYVKGYQDGVKEFAERVENSILHRLSCSTLEKKEAYYFCLGEIDNLLKEMDGE